MKQIFSIPVVLVQALLPYEFKRIYHAKLGKFVYQHKGSGLTVDNIFKPAKKMI